MDRTAINRALAKAMAYKQCGNREREADAWAAELVRLLECEGILRDGPATGIDRDRYVRSN